MKTLFSFCVFTFTGLLLFAQQITPDEKAKPNTGKETLEKEMENKTNLNK